MNAECNLPLAKFLPYGSLLVRFLNFENPSVWGLISIELHSVLTIFLRAIIPKKALF
jgi:hypothetical protein